MLNLMGNPKVSCDGVSRREMLQAGGAGLFGMSLPRLLQAEEVAGSSHGGRAKSVIFLFLFGGPSQLETFDMKPHAPSKIRGPFSPIASRTPDLRICEHLPRIAPLTDNLCVVRTMTHSFNDHSGGGHYLQTGRRWHIPIGGGFSATPKDWPSMGSVVEYMSQQKATKSQPLPSYIVVPNRLGHFQDRGQYVRPGEYAGWLGRSYDPLSTGIDKKTIDDNPFWRNCSDDELRFELRGMTRHGELTLDRLHRRKTLLNQFDEAQRLQERSKVVSTWNRFEDRAMAMVSSESTRAALDIRREPAALRDLYGRHLFGQSTLMARRLVEAGVRFVTVHYDCSDGYSWDSHVHSRDVRDHLLPTFDQALAALLTDLKQRGMLEETLVVALGEMGRTPRATSAWGRQHWSTLFPAVLAGAGIRGGTMYGQSDKDAAYPIEKPVKPEDLAATIYHALGIDPELRLPDAQGRPTSIVEEGQPVLDLFG